MIQHRGRRREVVIGDTTSWVVEERWSLVIQHRVVEERWMLMRTLQHRGLKREVVVGDDINNIVVLEKGWS